MGLIALVVGALPYIFAAHREQQKLSEILDGLVFRASNSKALHLKVQEGVTAKK
jgi:hypothetical protein